MATSDLHMHLVGYDYFADAPQQLEGLLNLLPVIEQCKDEAKNTLLFDNGDLLQGSPIADTYLAVHRQNPQADHPLISLMNDAGYDAANLGNHDLNYGLTFLQAVAAQASFPFLSSNLSTTSGAEGEDDQPNLQPWVMLARTIHTDDGAPVTLNIGVLGGLPKETEQWESAHVETPIQTRPIFDAVAAFVPQLKAQGADIVVVLAHSGWGVRSNGDETEAREIARIPGVDAVVAGHIHTSFPNPANPARWDGAMAASVMPGPNGSELGVIDLTLVRENSQWNVKCGMSEVRPIDTTATQRSSPPYLAKTLERVEALHQRTLKTLRKPLAQTPQALHSYFALITDSPACRVVAEAQLWYARSLQNAGSLPDNLPVIAATAPFKYGGLQGHKNFVDIAPGALLNRHVADLYPFNNHLCVARLPLGWVRKWLIRAAGIYAKITRGSSDQALFFPNDATYETEIFYGLDYHIHLDRDPSDPERVVIERLGNQPYAVDTDVLLVTNSYRAAGSGGYAPITTAARLAIPQISMPNLLRSFVQSNANVTLNTRCAEHLFAPMPGTSVTFPTGSKAIERMSDVQDLPLSPLHQDPDGFWHMRLSL